MISLYFNR